MAMPPSIRPLGDSALQVCWCEMPWMETFPWVHSLAKKLRDEPLEGLVATVPAFQTLTVHYDPLAWRWDELVRVLDHLIASVPPLPNESRRWMEIPVCYDEALGPDLDRVAQKNHLSHAEIVNLHTSAEFIVQMIGFSPGFPYLAGLPDSLVTPRLATPRLEVPSGAVAIGGRQAGIYSMPSPGGWNIIGRTPLKLFDPRHEPCVFLRAGDRLRFRSISFEDFQNWESSGT